MSRTNREILNGCFIGLLYVSFVMLPAVVGCDHKDPVQKPDGLHSVVVLPEAAEKRIADLEKFAASFPGPSVLELQEHARADEKKIADLDKRVAAIEKKDIDYFKNVFTLLGRVEDCEKVCNTEMDRENTILDAIKLIRAELADLKKHQCQCHCK